MAAITQAVLNVVSSKDEIVASGGFYGGTSSIFRDLDSYGIRVRYTADSTIEAFAACLTDNSRLIYVETIGNPKLDVPDLAALAALAHGKVSKLQHRGKGLYAGIPQGIEVGRYHSLIIERESLPDCLEITAELSDGTIMGIRHKEYDIQGMQFHPESILTPDGKSLMKNFLRALRN